MRVYCTAGPRLVVRAWLRVRDCRVESRPGRGRVATDLPRWCALAGGSGSWSVRFAFDTHTHPKHMLMLMLKTLMGNIPNRTGYRPRTSELLNEFVGVARSISAECAFTSPRPRCAVGCVNMAYGAYASSLDTSARLMPPRAAAAEHS